jgi:hypothetical protein
LCRQSAGLVSTEISDTVPSIFKLEKAAHAPPYYYIQHLNIYISTEASFFNVSSSLGLKFGP